MANLIQFHSRPFTIAGICILVLAGFLLRSTNLEAKGLLLRDEAWYTFAAHGLLVRLSNAIPESVRPLLGLTYQSNGLEFYEKTSSNNVSGKPLFVGLLAGLMWLGGSSSLVNLSALGVAVGTVGIAVTYICARYLALGRGAALVASLISALSPFQVLLARLIFTHATLILFCTLGIACYAVSFRHNSPERPIVLAGLLFGLALSLDPSFIIVFAALALIELGYSLTMIRQMSLRPPLRRLVALAIGMVAPAILFEMLYRVGHVLLPQAGLQSITGSYVLDLFHHGAEVATFQGLDPTSFLLFYPSALLGFEGPVTIGLALLGSWQIVKRREMQNGFLLILIVLTLVLATLAPYKSGRSIAGVFPMLALLGAAGFDYVMQLVAVRPPVMRVAAYGILLVALAAYVIVADSRILSLKSGWQDAAAFLRAHTPGNVIVNEVSDNAMLAMLLGRPVVLSSDPRNIATADYYLAVGNYRPAGWEEYSYGKEDTAFENYPQVFRPLLAISGEWPLVPWWPFDSAYPRSFVPGDDRLLLYRLH